MMSRFPRKPPSQGIQNRKLAVMTLDEIASLWGISRARAWQIECMAIAKLRRHPIMRQLAEECGLKVEE
jgi:DNA-directed RNA polymerase sigma subunit (sigma70/sigma32)